MIERKTGKERVIKRKTDRARQGQKERKTKTERDRQGEIARE